MDDSEFHSQQLLPPPEPATDAAPAAPTPGPESGLQTSQILGAQDVEPNGSSEQPNGGETGMNGTPNIYRGSSTPPNPTHLSNGAVLEEPSVTDQHLNDAGHGTAPNPPSDRVPSVPPVSAPSPSPAVPEASNAVNHQRPASASATAATSLQTARTRLPQDRIGILEDRIAEDARGDIEAWSELIDEYKKKNKLPETRKVYERFVKVFPSAADYWTAYANMELDHNNFQQAESIFQRALIDLPNVNAWTAYINYIRRRYNLNADPQGKHRKIVFEGFEFALKEVGRDKDSGNLWQEYIAFLRSMPGNINGATWEDQQKKDSLRAGYHKAICIPHGNIGIMWSEYNKFELAVDRAKAHSMLSKNSADYMQARSARHALEIITHDLDPTTVGKPPPALGFDGDIEYMRQVEIWKQWIEWEKSDPLVLKTDQLSEWKARVLYVYRQAVIPLRFWPEMWFSAGEFCFANALDSEGDKFLADGTSANPESCLLAFQRADRIESSTAAEGNSEDSLKRRGEAVRKPYDAVINALYALIERNQQRQTRDIARLEEAHQQRQATKTPTPPVKQDEDDYGNETQKEVNGATDAALAAQIDAITRGNAVQVELLKKTLSFAWIALMRAMRRIQGQGKPGEDEPVRGLRGAFSDARKRGKITSDVYIASALIEHHCFQDRVATKLFERGFKLFPNDVDFALAYIKHLFEIQDMTNARAVFKTMVGKLERDAQTIPRAKPLYAFWHEYESRYGELNLVKDLEQRMSELFPDDPKLALFSSRYSTPTFDPCAIRPMISPAVQARPKIFASIEQAAVSSVQGSPRALPKAMASAMPAGVTNSPKRSLEESDSEAGPPRKMAREESPLKGAAGRRLDAAKRSQMRNELSAGVAAPANEPGLRTVPGPTNHPLHPSVYNFMKLLPPSNVARQQLQTIAPTPQAVMELLQRADLSQFNHERLLQSLGQAGNAAGTMGTPTAQMPGSQVPGWQAPGGMGAHYGYGQPNNPYMYGR